MKRIILIFLYTIVPFCLAGQSDFKLSMLFKAQGNRCIYPDIEKVYGAGIGLEIDGNFNNKFKPLVTFNLDFFPRAALETEVNGKVVPDKKCIASVFLGAAYHPIEKLWISFECGPSFIQSQTYFSVKPAVGYFFDKNQRFGIDLSLTNILKLDIINDSSYGYLSLGFKVRFL